MATKEQYAIIDSIHKALRNNGYSFTESFNYMARHGVLSPNKQEVRKGVTTKYLKAVLREAEKERKVYQ